MSDQTKKIDAELYELLNSLPSFPFYSLIRQDPEELKSAKEKFFSSGTPPVFSYSMAERFDVKNYQKRIDEVLIKIKDSDQSELLKNLYIAKVEELHTRLSIILAINNKDDVKVTELSKDLFSFPEENLTTLTAEFEEMLSHASAFFEHKKKVTPELFIEMTGLVLDHYNMDSWKISLYSGSSIKIRHGNSSSTIFVPEDRNLSKARAARLLTHEIEVHALRTMNGRNSPYMLLGRGLDGYIQTEEGLAVHYQSKLAKKTHQHLPGFWDAWAVAIARQNNFTETFKILSGAQSRLSEAKETHKTEKEVWNEAWRLCIRVYRGISDTNRGQVVFSRDHIYRSGALMLERTLKQKGDEIIPILFSGKIALHHLDTIIALDVPKGRVPDMISSEIMKKVMKAK